MTNVPQFIDYYQLIEPLGDGSLGTVWRAYDSSLSRTVAMKVLKYEAYHDLDMVPRFTKEAIIVANLRHPNIVTLHNFYEARNGNPPYMVMDLIEGPTLEKYIATTSRKGNCPSNEIIVYLFTKIAQALDYAHANNVVHRDIKPANILLDQYQGGVLIGEPMVTDFGIERPPDLALTLIGTTEGTPSYMPPEQIKGQAPDKRSDIYSLGIILYLMYVGKVPFQGSSMHVVLMKHVCEPPPSPLALNRSRVTPAVEAVILKCLAKQPEQRYTSCMEMVADLAQALHLPLPPGAKAETEEYDNNPLGLEYKQTSSVLISETLPDIPSHTKTEQLCLSRKSIRLAPLITAGMIVLVVLISIAGLLWNSSKGGTHTDVSRGQVYFSHSKGSHLFDTVQIDLRNVASPPAGKIYYLWIVLPDNETQPNPAWPLQVKDGRIQSGPLHGPQEMNLLAVNNIVLVTLENNSSSPPVVATSDVTQQRYYVEITQRNKTTFTLQSCPTGTTANICSRR